MKIFFKELIIAVVSAIIGAIVGAMATNYYNEKSENSVEIQKDSTIQEEAQGNGFNEENSATHIEYTQKISDKRLIDLNTFDEEDGGLFYDSSNKLIDNLENVYYGGIRMGVYQGGSNIYKLNGDYSRLTGKICLYFEHRTTEAKGMVEIYGDGVLLHTSPVITGGIEPQEFDIDILGVDLLKIRFVGDRISSGFFEDYVNYTFLADVTLHSNV